MFYLALSNIYHNALSPVASVLRYNVKIITLRPWETPENSENNTPSAPLGLTASNFWDFRLLNLKNDALRKRFDALKYDL